MSRLKIQLPADDAPVSEWFKTVLLKMDDFYNQCDDLKSLIQFNNEELESCRQEIGKLKDEVCDLKQHTTFLECQNQDLSRKYRDLVESQINSEIRTRENNLVFDGIKETYGEHSGSLYHKIVKVLNHMFVLNGRGAEVTISKLQRVGHFVKGQNRPVVVHFVRYCDIELILSNKAQLPKDVFVREDYPPAVENRRRILRPILSKAKKIDAYKGKCKLMRDKLILKGKTYTVEPVNNLDELPLDLSPRVTAERENEDVIVFFTQGSPFSNFHHSPFDIDNTRYSCNEQYIQACKALLFNDDITHAKIMHTVNPYDIKKLGYEVKNYVKDTWEKEAKAVALKGCLAKFSQNGHLLEALIKTGQKSIGEATKNLHWGIGMPLNDHSVLESSRWAGQNVLGNVLMQVRGQLQ